ncbi:MAG: aminodeoxychorismate synthase component I [Chloroflexi bacterium]|nr:aminodeoxychorismate synthase component I [Chloroflexota bacterium]
MQRLPLVKELPQCSDPISIFNRLKSRPYSFLLDSGMWHTHMGRYSFAGCDPFLILKSRGRSISLQKPGVELWQPGDPLDALREVLNRFSMSAVEGLPFSGGVVGYLGYDLCHLMEELPSTAVDDLQLPDCCLGVYDLVLVFDHIDHQAFAVASGFPETRENERLSRAGERLEQFLSWLGQSGDNDSVPDYHAESPSSLPLRSNFSREGYLRSVEKAKDYIMAGDIFQVNLSQRFEAGIAIPPFDLYRLLRRVNPAPFACYFSAGDAIVAGASPERFLAVRGSLVQTRPIKGTRPRSDDPIRDAALARELTSSSKDRAENIMIVDLERNDLGRVCRYGSVRVTETAALEKFPSVFHLTSTVEGLLRPGADRIDLIRATFPGGSITGAPKVRSMEIIDELEPTRRSVYTGSLGYIGFDGDMDLNILIRTFLIKGNRAYFQVGGGIVYDSKPEDEYEETLHKARALIAALKLAPVGVT